MLSEIQKRIQRLNEVLEIIIKNNPDLQKQEKLAKALGYKRPGTISDYKNVKRYSHERFIKFIERLSLRYDVNVDYIMHGTGSHFLLKRGEVVDTPIILSPEERDSKIQSLEYSIQILGAQIDKLKSMSLEVMTNNKKKGKRN